MKVVIAGSREGFSLEDVYKAVEESGFDITEVVSGTARGVDSLGEDWANENGVVISQFPADWDKYGKRAGFVRNRDMASYGDAVLALWDGSSKGTQNMIELARFYKLKLYVYRK